MKNSRSVTALWTSVSGSFLNLLYPRRCPLCHQVLKDQKRLLCPECEKGLRPVTGAVCFRCGMPVGEREEYCAACSSDREFDQGRGIFLYDQKMKHSMIRYKYHGCREYGRFYAKAMYLYGRERISRWKPDLLIPVPLHPVKRRKRGFDQAALLAEELSGYTGIPADTTLVKKTKKTGDQKKLTAPERRKNLREAFQVERRVDGLRLLVVDDVYTTGSTMDAMAACLKESGAERVFFLTVCTGTGRTL